MQGEDHPGIISVFQSRFVSALKWTGGSAFSGAIPEAFGPLNWSQCMDSALKLSCPVDSELKELRQMSKVMHTGKAFKEEMVEILR
jgi:hypothetical protein